MHRDIWIPDWLYRWLPRWAFVVGGAGVILGTSCFGWLTLSMLTAGYGGWVLVMREAARR